MPDPATPQNQNVANAGAATPSAPPTSPPPPTFMQETPPPPTKPPEPGDNQPPVGGGSPPGEAVVSGPSPKGLTGKSRAVVTILGVLLLVGGIAAGVFLVQQQQEIREKAAVTECQDDTDCEIGFICIDTQCVIETPLPTGTALPGETPLPTTSPEATASPTVTATTTPVPITAQCKEVKAFDTSWNQLTASDLAALEAGDTVRFTVYGTASSGNFDKGQFTINGTQRSEVTSKRPGTDEFYDEYTISDDMATFNVTAQIHHEQQDVWF
jgi:hypothetical protein